MLEVLSLWNGFLVVSVLLVLVGVCWSRGRYTFFNNFLMNEHLRNSWTLKLLLKVLHRLFFRFRLLAYYFWIFLDSLSFSEFRFIIIILILILNLIYLLVGCLICCFWRELDLICRIFALAGRKSYFFLFLSMEWLLTSWRRINFRDLFLI